MIAEHPRDAGQPAPFPPLRFARRYPDGSSPLLVHVEKHLLQQRDERWHELVPMDELDLARDPAQPPDIAEAVRHLLATRYEGLAASLIIEHWLHGRDLAGWQRTLDERTLRWGLAAWDERRRLWAVAACETRPKLEAEHECKPCYRLLTCYRTAVHTKQDLSVTRFRQWVLAQLRQYTGWPGRLVACAPGPVRALLLSDA